jgi:hypothetical protein
MCSPPNFFHDDMNAMVVGGGMGEVPCFGGMIPPCFVLAGFLMNEDLRAQWCHQRGVKQEGPFQCFVCGQERVTATWAHHVKRGVALRHESAPIGLGEPRWESGDPRHEVVPPCRYHAFSGVGAVHVGGSVLEIYLFRRNECFNDMGCLIVHFVEEGPISPGH